MTKGEFYKKYSANGPLKVSKRLRDRVVQQYSTFSGLKWYNFQKEEIRSNMFNELVGEKVRIVPMERHYIQGLYEIGDDEMIWGIYQKLFIH